MISVTRKSQMASLPLLSGKPMWARGSSCTASVMMVRCQKVKGSAEKSLSPGHQQPGERTVHEQQGQQSRQVHQGGPQHPAGLGQRAARAAGAPEAQGAGQ